jgi:magnesium-transporting ATPase (P-type)
MVSEGDSMIKGVGFYSPHETTVFFLKTLLLSFWFGIDLVAVLIAATFSPDSLAQYRVLTAIAMAILIFGTTFAAVFAWAAGSLVAVKQADVRPSRVPASLAFLKRHSWQLIAIGIANLSILLTAVTVHFMFSPPANGPANRAAHASPAMAKKCAEVASLERQQFQANELTSMAECLIQYDEKYSFLRNSKAQGK